MIPVSPLSYNSHIQTPYGRKRSNFIDRAGHVCANSWKITEYAGNYTGGTLWKSSCVTCGEPHRHRGIESKVIFSEIERRKPCKCGGAK